MSRILTYGIMQQGNISTLKTNLLSCWKFDETSGTIFYDALGNYAISGANVTANNAGKINNAATFSGSGSYLTLPTQYKFTRAFGFSMWFYCTNWASTYPGLFGGISFGSVSTNGGIGLSYFKTAGAAQGIFLDVYSSNSRYVARTNTGVTINNWHHITGGYDGSSKLYYYLDGVKSNINSTIGTINIDWTNSSIFRLGSTQQPANTWNAFTGKIDQFAVWNRMLTDDEMLQIYNSGSGLAFSSW